MGVGGFCAEGSAYEIAVHCPKSSAWMTPLSVFLGMILAMVYGFSSDDQRPNYTILFWPALFFSLGANFFEFGFGITGPGSDFSWIFTGTLFWIMASLPLFALTNLTEVKAVFIGKAEEKDWLYITLHTLCVPLGAFLGWWVVVNF